MAHFAELNSNNEVTRIIVVGDADTADSDGNEVESIGVAFCKSLYGSDTNWKQASYNKKLRGNYPSIGSTYDEAQDIFIPLKPYPSWVFNTETKDWEAPSPRPSLTESEAAEGSPYQFGAYYWEEESTSWVMEYPSEDENGEPIIVKRTD